MRSDTSTSYQSLIDILINLSTYSAGNLCTTSSARLSNGLVSGVGYVYLSDFRTFLQSVAAIRRKISEVGTMVIQSSSLTLRRSPRAQLFAQHGRQISDSALLQNSVQVNLYASYLNFFFFCCAL